METPMKMYWLILDKTELNPDGTRKYKINKVAFTERPAIEEAWIAMKDESLKIKFTALDVEKRIVMGPLMVANKPILRIDEKTGEPFMVMLSADTIDEILLDMAENNWNKNIDHEHTPNMLDQICMYKVWTINSDLGITPPTAWNNLSDGSAMGVWKVNNDIAWSKVLDGTYTGPSIEGFLKLQEVVALTDEEIGEILSTVK